MEAARLLLALLPVLLVGLHGHDAHEVLDTLVHEVRGISVDRGVRVHWQGAFHDALHGIGSERDADLS